MSTFTPDGDYRQVYEELVSELAGYFECLVRTGGGSCSESLRVDAEGRLSADGGPNGIPPLFSVLVSMSNPSDKTGTRMTVDEACQLLRDVMEVLPDHSIRVNDDRKSGRFEYEFQRVLAK